MTIKEIQLFLKKSAQRLSKCPSFTHSSLLPSEANIRPSVDKQSLLPENSVLHKADLELQLDSSASNSADSSDDFLSSVDLGGIGSSVVKSELGLFEGNTDVDHVRKIGT